MVAILAGVFLVVDETSPPWYERLRYPLRYEAIVRSHARNYDLDPALLAAVIYQESKFHPSAKSPSGAVGLMQLTPETAKGIAIRTGGHKFTTDDLSTRRSTSATARGTCGTSSRSTAQERLVLAAYNAGQGNVDEWRANGPGDPVLGDAGLRRQGRGPEEDLPRRVRALAGHSRHERNASSSSSRAAGPRASSDASSRRPVSSIVIRSCAR